jgi:hypothetical protein
VVVPEGTNAIERTYGGTVTFQRVLQPVNDTEAVPLAFHSPQPGTIRWTIEPGTHRFVVESRISGALFPAIDIPAAREYWRQALQSPATRARRCRVRPHASCSITGSSLRRRERPE